MNQPCKCAHPKAEHAGSAGTGKCRDSCGCGRFRAAGFITPPTLESGPAEGSGDAAETGDAA